MVQNRLLVAVATLAALGVVNGFIVNPCAGLQSSQRAMRVHSSRMRMSYDPSNELKRASADGAEALKKADLHKEASESTIDATSREARAVAGEREVIREAPIVRERIREKTVEVDKTRIEEERIRTEVVQRVVPIKDERRVEEDVKRVDHGVEVREHGKSGLDKGALDELERRRQEVASKAGTTRDATTEKISERPDVVKKERLQVVEQVVPVIERDVYVPHRVEHEKRVKEVYHEKPVVKQTVVEPAITREEFEKKFDRKLDSVSAEQQLSSAQQQQQQRSGDVRSSVGSSATTHSNAPGSSKTAEHKESVDTRVHASADSKLHAAGKDHTGKDKHTDGSHSDDSYSMSSSNMARDAEHDADHSDGSGSGLGEAIKKPFKAVANLVEKIVD